MHIAQPVFVTKMITSNRDYDADLQPAGDKMSARTEMAETERNGSQSLAPGNRGFYHLFF